MEDFRTGLVDKYLFREAKSNATNLVPTFYVQPQGDLEKQADSIRKMIKKVRQSVLNYKHKFVTPEQVNQIEQMLLGFRLSTAVSYLFTMRIDGRYFGDFKEYQELFVSDAYQKYRKDSYASEQVCSVTYEKVPEVWGRVDTLGFTVNDIAFSRNGFEGTDSYKMFPVSPEVVKLLEGSKRLILDKLSRNFFGMKYFVLPRFIGQVSKENVELVLQEFVTKCDASANTMHSQFGPLIHNEDIIGEILDSERLNRNSVYYDIFFFQPNKAQFMIKLHISDVLPSRFKRIMDTKRNVESVYQPILDQMPVSKTEFERFSITFAYIKDYFAEYSKAGGWIFHPYFFRIVEAVFYNTPLDREQLMRVFTDAIRISFKNSTENPYQFSRDVRHTFVILQFFQRLNLISTSGMEQSSTDSVGLTLDAFAQQHPDLFQNPLRKAAFYLGCATEKLLEKQRNHLRNEPFRKNLNGLNLDVEQLRKIHLKLIDKISQYSDAGKLYPSEREYLERLDSRIASVLLMDDSSISKTDISYAFAAGMAMQKEFTKEQIRIAKLNSNTNNTLPTT